MTPVGTPGLLCKLHPKVAWRAVSSAPPNGARSAQRLRHTRWVSASRWSAAWHRGVARSPILFDIVGIDDLLSELMTGLKR
jgi:hypothetical protein